MVSRRTGGGFQWPCLVTLVVVCVTGLNFLFQRSSVTTRIAWGSSSSGSSGVRTTAAEDADEQSNFDWEKYYRPGNTSYPPKALSLAELGLCQKYNFDAGWPKCENDTSCLECIYPRGREMAANVTKAFRDPKLALFRRNFLISAFGVQGQRDPNNNRTIVNLMIVDKGFSVFVMNWICGVCLFILWHFSHFPKKGICICR